MRWKLSAYRISAKIYNGASLVAIMDILIFTTGKYDTEESFMCSQLKYTVSKMFSKEDMKLKLVLHRYDCTYIKFKCNDTTKQKLYNSGQCHPKNWEIILSFFIRLWWNMSSIVQLHIDKSVFLASTPTTYTTMCVTATLSHIIPIVERGTPLSAAADLTVCPQSFNPQKQTAFISEDDSDI